MMLWSTPPSFFFLRGWSTAAVQALATVDFTVANRVSEDVAQIVQWSYDHDLPQFARWSVLSLQFADDVGSMLIAAVVWLVTHTP